MRVSKIQISMALIYWWKAKAESLVARLKPKLDDMGLSLNFPPSAFRFGNKRSQMIVSPSLFSIQGVPMPLWLAVRSS